MWVLLIHRGGVCRTIKHRQSWVCRIVKLDIRWIRSIRGPFKGALRSKSLENLFQNYTNLFDFRIDFG